MREGQGLPLNILVDALKLYNDLTFRLQIDKIDRQLQSGAISEDEKKKLEEKKNALLANILEDVLKPRQ